MKRFNIKNKAALLRAGGIFAAVAIIISGVTFAILQSQQATLMGNTIETATANLHISTDGVQYADGQPGYEFTNLVPGGHAVPSYGFPVYLRNDGSTPLALKLAVNLPPSNPANVDLNRVNVLVSPQTAGAATQSFTLQSLIDASATGGLAIDGDNLANGSTREFKLQVSMAGDAFTGSSTGIEGLDLSFSGVAVDN